MNYIVGDTFVNYALTKDLKEAHKAGIFEDFGDDSEQEDRFVSELERRMMAIDEKETYIVVKTLVNTHRKTVAKTLEYMERKGRENETD